MGPSQGQYSIECSGRKFFVTRPTGEQFWSFLGRQLAFEDPEDKYKRLCGLASRQVKESSRSVDIEGLECADLLMQAVYGVANREPCWEERALNVLLAAEDLERFTVSGFDSWKARAGRSLHSSADCKASPFSAWIRSRELTAAQSDWLERAATVVPDWDKLRVDGPWQDDPRCLFLIRCLSRLKSEFTECGPDMDVAQELFSAELESARENLPGDFLPALVLFVEGPTEGIVLPAAARLLSFDLDKNAVLVLVGGGAKPLTKRFLELREVMSLPAVAVLDVDAAEQAAIMKDMAREEDRILVFAQGEIEDTFDLSFFVRVLNLYLETNRSVEPFRMGDLQNVQRRTLAVNRLWRLRGLGDFDKIGLARLIAREMLKPEDVPGSVATVIKQMRAVLNGEMGGY